MNGAELERRSYDLPKSIATLFIESPRVSTDPGQESGQIFSRAESAMMRLRSAMSAILTGVAAPIPELANALDDVLTLVGEPRGRGFTPECWELYGEVRLHQIFVSAFHLGEGADEVSVTLVHELAHLLAHVRQLKETSNRDRYHNKRFKECAEELGLIVERGPRHGYYVSGLSLGLRRQLGSELRALEESLVIRMTTPPASSVGILQPTASGAVIRRKYVSAVCGCQPNRVIRVARGHWLPDSIGCLLCGQLFVDLKPESYFDAGSALAMARVGVTGEPASGAPAHITGSSLEQ